MEPRPKDLSTARGEPSLTRPEGVDSPVVVEVPHACTWLDPESLAHTTAPARSIARDADLYVDELAADTPTTGATLVTAGVSRLVVDLNRAPHEYDELTAEGGLREAHPRGVLWRLTTDGDPVIAGRLSRGEVERRLARFHRPYHALLRRLLEEKRERFGFAVLLSAHSMPSQARPLRVRPGEDLDPLEVVPGTRGGTSAHAMIARTTELVARASGLSVRHDDPYRGGFITASMGRPAEAIHAIQVEVARRLYMDERSFARIEPGFSALRALFTALAEALSFEGAAEARALLSTRHAHEWPAHG